MQLEYELSHNNVTIVTFPTSLGISIIKHSQKVMKTLRLWFLIARIPLTIASLILALISYEHTVHLGNVT